MPLKALPVRFFEVLFELLQGLVLKLSEQSRRRSWETPCMHACIKCILRSTAQLVKKVTWNLS